MKLTIWQKIQSFFGGNMARAIKAAEAIIPQVLAAAAHVPTAGAGDRTVYVEVLAEEIIDRRYPALADISHLILPLVVSAVLSRLPK